MPQKPLVSDLDAWLAQDSQKAGAQKAPVVDTSDLDSFLSADGGNVDTKPVGFGVLDPDKAPKERGWLDTLIEALPSLGGTIGGIAGGVGGTVAGMGVGGVPGAVGGAALGAAGGEGFKKAINFVRGQSEVGDNSEAEVIKDMAWEGGKNAAFELGGHGIAKGVVAPVAKAITKKVFNPTAKMLEKTQDLMTDIMDYGVGHSEKGLAKATSLTNASRQAADDAILVAEQNGLRVPRSELLDATVTNPYGHESSLDIIGKRAEKTPGLTQLGNSWDNVIKDNSTMLLPTEMQALKRSEAKAAKSVFEGVGDPTLQKQIHADYASGARNSLETRIPGLAETNAETQKRLMVLQAVDRALTSNEAKHLTANSLAKLVTVKTLLGATGAAVGGPVGAAALMAGHQVMKNPTVAAAGARGLYGVSKHPEVLANAIRGVGGLVTEESAQQKRQREIQEYLQGIGR